MPRSHSSQRTTARVRLDLVRAERRRRRRRPRLRAHALEHSGQQQPLLRRAEARRGTGRQDDCRDHHGSPLSVILSIIDRSAVRQLGGAVAELPIRSTRRMPVASPCRRPRSPAAGRVAPVTTKNWLPAVPGGSVGRLRHRDDAVRVRACRRRACRRRVARPARAGARRVAALDDEAGDDPVEARAVEEARLGERSRTTRRSFGADFGSSVIVNVAAVRRRPDAAVASSSRAGVGFGGSTLLRRRSARRPGGSRLVAAPSRARRRGLRRRRRRSRASASSEHDEQQRARLIRPICGDRARRTSARAISTLYAVPGSGVAASRSASTLDRPRDRRDAREREPRLAAAARRRDADDRERPAPPVHRLQVRARLRRGGTSSSRISSSGSSVVVLAVVVGRQAVQLGHRQLARGRPQRRAERDAAPRRDRTGAPKRRSRWRRSRARGARPRRVAAVAAVQPARELEPPVPAARRLEEVPADRAHRAQLRRRREPARLAQRVRHLRVGLELGERRARADPRAVDRRAARRPRGATSVSACDEPVAHQRDELRPAGERDRAVPERRGRLLGGLGRRSSNALLRALPRLAQRPQHLLARDRQRADVGARRVADRVGDRGRRRDDRRLAEALRAEVRQVLRRARRRTR